MTKLEGKRILLIFQSWRTFKGSLHEMLYQALCSTGMELDYLDIENPPVFENKYWPDKLRNIYERKFRNNTSFYLVAENKFYNRFFLKRLKQLEVRREKYDYVLIIKPEEYSPQFIKKASRLGNKTVGYIWDGLRLFFKPNIVKSRKHLDALFSFDTENIQDHPELQMQFVSNFSIPSTEKFNYKERELDLFYVGDLASKLPEHRRDIQLSKFLKNVKGNFEINIWMREAFENVQKLNDPKIHYIKNTISLEETFKKTQQSKVVIDMCKKHHIGLSFRFFECLSSQTKIITNNKDVVNYDFYDSNNIMVVDFENDVLDQHVFDEFLNRPYTVLPSDITEKYEIHNWVKYLFKIDGFKEITKNKIK